MNTVSLKDQFQSLLDKTEQGNITWDFSFGNEVVVRFPKLTVFLAKKEGQQPAKSHIAVLFDFLDNQKDISTEITAETAEFPLVEKLYEQAFFSAQTKTLKSISSAMENPSA